MVVKKLKELYQVDTISQDKGWGKVHEALGELDHDVEIDFTNINVVDPWNCLEFKRLLMDKHVHMMFVNSDSIVNRIKMMCIIDGLDENRIRNKVVEVQKEKTPEERKIERYGNELISIFDITPDGMVVLDLEKKYDQIQSTNTLNYIDYAIREVHKTQGYDKFTLKIGKLVILPNVLQVIANMMVEYESLGFHLWIDCEDEETQKNMGLFIHIATTNKYTVKERRAAITKNLKTDMAGILIKYKKSKALDEFGREGKGEVISSRVAIFRGLKQIDTGDTVALIDEFSNDYFYTIQQWMVEHDYEEPTSLHAEKLEIPLDKLGICDMFLGSKYHFLLPVQRDELGTQVVIKEISDNGSNIKVKCTIPERMKIVFDSWGVKYDKQSLDEAIEETKKYLEKLKAGQVNHVEGINEVEEEQ